MHLATLNAERHDTGQEVTTTPAPWLDDDGVLCKDVDIAFSTHLTLVVPARVEFACGAAPQDIDLVIARKQCRDHRPRLQALLDAVPSALCRGAADRKAAGHPCALSARIAGHWQALWFWPAGSGGLAPHGA